MTFTNAHAEALIRLLFQNKDGAGAEADTAYTLVGTSGLLKSSTVGSLYVSLHSADPGIAGNQSTNEISTGDYDTYARVAVARADFSDGTTAGWKFTSPNKVENNAAITWAAKGNIGTASVLWAGIGTDASGAGALLFRCPLALETPKPFVVESADLTANDITTCGSGNDTAHGYLANEQVVFIDVEGGTLPGGITEGTAYYVMSSPTTNTFRVSAASGDTSPVDITSTGIGLVAKVVPKTVTQNDVFEIASGKLVVFFR